MTDEGIKINMLVFRFTPPLIPKEICSFNKVIILKDINKKRTCRTKGHLIEKPRDNELIDKNIKKFDDIKKFNQNIETDIRSYSSTAFTHRHRHIVHTSCKKNLVEKI